VPASVAAIASLAIPASVAIVAASAPESGAPLAPVVKEKATLDCTPTAETKRL
jgi:hypothetical protein